jgi:hypothetical protein
MTGHRYACGQNVTFFDKRFTGRNWSGSFVIIKQLPSGDEAPRYQIKSTGETYSRAAYEHQLSASFTIVR